MRGEKEPKGRRGGENERMRNGGGGERLEIMWARAGRERAKAGEEIDARIKAELITNLLQVFCFFDLL